MSDGIELAADIYLPPQDGKTYPTILSLSPYDSTSGRNAGGMNWAARGFAYVSADCRGRFKSGGEFIPWKNDVRDAGDLLDWIVDQPWCSGSIGMVGGSYVGFTQLAAAASGHPALKAVAPSVIQGDLYGIYYFGGALALTFMSSWHISMSYRGPALNPPPDWLALQQRLPVNQLDDRAGMPCPLWNEIVSHPQRDAFWRKCSVQENLGKTQASFFMQGGWFDNIGPAMINAFGQLPKGRHSCLRIGPWGHGVNEKQGEIDYGRAAQVSEEAEVDFLSSLLTGREPATARNPAPLQLFIMGLNAWRFEDEWPLKRTQWTPYYLGSGTLSRDPAAADNASSDTFTYDPGNPVPTCGGRGATDAGQRNQAEIEKRGDVLVYSSAPLAADLEVTGPVSLILFASSSAPDTDFTVKLVDVYPDGQAFNVCDGILRARFRGGIDNEPHLLEPGKVCEMTVDVDCTATVFRRGHALRIQLSSSNFPRYSRNLNTGGDSATETDARLAVQTVYHSKDYPTRLILPVIPAGG